ncbi:MAG TPA: type II toxin-antitoxin system VapC family toxin [Verrucomicrobiae bacterium]|nr:type II toxin-antitoxin system VapC family toxin [Verrucomicrobiae bacterium]
MSSNYLLDTNTASYVIKGNIPAVRARLVRIPVRQVFISSVSEGELRYGVARKPGATKWQHAVEEFLLRMAVLSWDSSVAKVYGDLRANLERLGQPMGALDMMIGAHALAVDAILVSNDRAFTRINGLKVEDWTV